MNSMKKIRILTVDDSKTILSILKKELTDQGFDVIQAIDGLNALEVLEAAEPKPNMIITDINMPRLDGFGFIKAVRALNNDDAHLPIICLTTEVNDDKRDEGRRVGANGWMCKPFSQDNLLSTIQRVTA